MVKSWFTKIVGTRFRRELKRIRPIVDAIHGHEERLKTLSDAELQAQTAKLRGIVAERTGALGSGGERLKRQQHDCPEAEHRAALGEHSARAAAPSGTELHAGLYDCPRE